ncbi:hypothetical protein ACFPTR_09630 [Aliibacillus thermotolerans]|uniref:Uncharacterized protein n=1 Tax=Aliibacillus thermotolerans TaxID=1834418 RepID=A0ABW0U844_9BACI|nr:hypothetical protein [Aliibacillus thermotolerans]MDA3129619.1 hypothetical protein [Aliibacillus thermotolerans]
MYVNTYLHEKPREITVIDGVNKFDFQLYFHCNEEIPKGRMAIVRTIGMKIEDFKVPGHATKPTMIRRNYRFQFYRQDVI